jgi:hypothetical protein
VTAPSLHTRPSRDLPPRPLARPLALAGLVIAAVLPVLLWRRSIAAVASDFRLDVGYLVTGWAGYGLIAIGLLFLVPAALTVGRSPRGPLLRRRNAYVGWGICCYLLGCALSAQVAQIADGLGE